MSGDSFLLTAALFPRRLLQYLSRLAVHVHMYRTRYHIFGETAVAVHEAVAPCYSSIVGCLSLSSPDFY